MIKRLAQLLEQIQKIPDKYNQNNFRLLKALIDSYVINFSYETMTKLEHLEYCDGLEYCLSKYRTLRGR